MTMDKRYKVFIIDDNEMTRAVLRMIIQGVRFDVVGDAAGASAGLERALRLRPDIICLDVQMPERDGLEILETLVAQLPDAVVLMVTARNDAPTVKMALERGARGFIVKPFNSGTVLDTMDAACVLIERRRQEAR